MTRHLKEASELGEDQQRAVFAAVTLSYLGYFSPDQQDLDGGSLQKMTEILAELDEDGFPQEFQQRCMQCPKKVDCPAGKLVLNG